MTFSRSQRRRRLLLLFVALFVLAVVTQLGVGWYQRRATARSNVQEAMNEIRQELRYSDHWDLKRFRQADLSSRYYVLDRSGLVINIQDFVPELGFQADPTTLQPGIRSLTEPLTNETWRLLVVPLKGGVVVLGASPPEDFTHVDERLQENAKHFGRSLEEALKFNPSDIENYLDFAVLDDAGHLRIAFGGIPLKLVAYPRLPLEEIGEIHAGKSAAYAFLTAPVRDASGQAVGTVTVLDQLPPQPWRSFRAWLTNLLSSLVLACVGTWIGARYIRREFQPEDLLRDALHGGESSTVEFKEALRWDRWQDRPAYPDDPRKGGDMKGIAEMVAVKTVAGFLNSRPGGTLFIGIADDKKIVGLDRDYESLVKPGENRGGQDKDRDRFQLHLRNLLAGKIGPEVSNLCVETAILSPEGKDVCVVAMSPSPRPVYIGEAKRKSFYLRVGAATDELDVEEATGYCQERWPRPLRARFRRWRRSA